MVSLLKPFEGGLPVSHLGQALWEIMDQLFMTLRSCIQLHCYPENLWTGRSVNERSLEEQNQWNECLVQYSPGSPTMAMCMLKRLRTLWLLSP